MTLDMLIVSLPVLDLQYPPSSPAVIKACVQAAGFRARTYDLNLLLLEICSSKDHFLEVQYNFENVGPEPVGPVDSPVDAFFDNDKDLIRQWLDASIDIIEDHAPRWLGLSVFSYKSHKACLLLLSELKRRSFPIKIVLGGRGASSYALGPDHNQFRRRIQDYFGPYPSPAKNFCETMLYYGLVDKVIQGDGEQAVIDLLTRNTDENTVTDVSLIDLESVPFVDFDDYDIRAYDYIN